MNYLKFLIILTIIITASHTGAVDKAHLRWLRDKPLIDSIVVNGNNSISTAEIESRMYSKVQSAWKKIKKDRRIKVQRETLGRDTLEIKYLYLTNGFLNVKLSENFHQLDKYQKIKNERNKNDSIPMAMIWVNIDEGSQFKFGKHQIIGNHGSKISWNLTKLMEKLKDGENANLLEIHKTTFDMKTELANQGYPYSTISHTIDTLREQGKADIIFIIDTDSLVYFGEIAVEGMEHFPEYVGLRELKIKTGELYSRKSILDSQKRLFESGYFTFSQLTQADSAGNRLTPDFVLKVKERKPWFVGVTAGAGQSDFRDLIWDFNFGIGKRDVDFTNFNKFYNPKFNKGGHRISVNADYSFAIPRVDEFSLFTHKYRLRYTTPWTLGIRMPISLSVEWEPKIQSQLGDYDIRKWGFSAKTQKWYGNEIYTTAGLEYNNVKYSEFGENIDSLDVLNDNSVRRKLFTTFRLDSRDNIFIPRTGQLTFISSEIFGGFLGGGDNFYKIDVAWSTYQPVWPGWIYAVRLKGGIAKEFGNSKNVPIDERLYLGGANSIRGFTENTLGPTHLGFDTTRTPVDTFDVADGANYTIIVNNEFRWKTVQFLNIFGSFFKKFPQWQSVFFDAGNGFANSREIKLDQFAYSYGTGIQIVSPAGPIRIDYARRIKTDRYDVDSRWHFTILYAF